MFIDTTTRGAGWEVCMSPDKELGTIAVRQRKAAPAWRVVRWANDPGRTRAAHGGIFYEATGPVEKSLGRRQLSEFPHVSPFV